MGLAQASMHLSGETGAQHVLGNLSRRSGIVRGDGPDLALVRCHGRHAVARMKDRRAPPAAMASDTDRRGYSCASRNGLTGDRPAQRRSNGETRGAGGLGESLGALPRGAATCDDAAPSGAHASSTADHARILAADYVWEYELYGGAQGPVGPTPPVCVSKIPHAPERGMGRPPRNSPPPSEHEVK
eukprot:scaffold2405_cov113-Isochrysis_galbana.AAC.1